MSPTLIATLVILFVVVDVFIVKWILSRRKKSPAIEEFVAAQGWNYQDLPPVIGQRHQFLLSNDHWELKVSYVGKSHSLARIVWSSSIKGEPPFVVAPPLAPHISQIMKSAPGGIGNTMIEGAMGVAMKQLGAIPSGLDIQKETIGDHRGILLTENRNNAAAEKIYSSSALSQLRSDLPVDSEATIIVDGTNLAINAEINTKNLDQLLVIIEIGQALRNQLV